MRVNLNWQTTTGFMALLFVMHELHEIVHTGVGRLMCGCWGPRNFNSWGLCENCAVSEPWTLLSTLAGPVFTFGMIWIGYHFLKEDRTVEQKSFGFALVFANMPFGRLLTVSFFGGDEGLLLRTLFGEYVPSYFLLVVGVAIVLVLIVPPLVRTWKVMESRNRLWIFIGFFVLPFVFDVAVVIFGMNTILEMGVLDQRGIIGSPVLLNLWTLLWIGLLAYFGASLRRMLVPERV